MLNEAAFKQKQADLLAAGVAETNVLKVLNQAATTNWMAFYEPLRKDSTYFLLPNESPAITERLQELVTKVELALPNILNLTNKLNAVLDNSSALASNLNVVALNAQPAVSNFTLLAQELRGPGALGEWALGTNGQQSLEAALGNANQLLSNTDTNLVALMESFGATLENLANITSNLNAQVQANTNMLSSISQAVVNTDDLVQGLKRHWLLRSAFKKKK
jgi:methyl-accepting chemotaxis protein